MIKYEVTAPEKAFLVDLYSTLKTTKSTDWCTSVYYRVSETDPERGQCCMVGHLSRESYGHDMAQASINIVHNMTRQRGSEPSATYAESMGSEQSMYFELHLRWRAKQGDPKILGDITNINDGKVTKVGGRVYGQAGPKGRSMAHLRDLIASAKVVETIMSA
jgi:hypothetical protein